MKINKLVIGSVAIILLVALLLFGVAGLITVIAMAAFFILPAYLIIDLFDFNTGEKLFFSFSLGLGFFPLLVWYVNRIIPSLRASLALTFVLVVGIGLYLRHRKKR